MCHCLLIVLLRVQAQVNACPHTCHTQPEEKCKQPLQISRSLSPPVPGRGIVVRGREQVIFVGGVGGERGSVVANE